MNIPESQMSGNVYNKTDADTWMTAPKLSQTKRTSFIDAQNLVLYDEKFLDGLEEEECKPVDIDNLYKNRTPV